MGRRGRRISALTAAAVLLIAARSGAGGQNSLVSSLDETGKISSNGHQISYRIRNLPVSSFPELPQSVATALTDRGCVIPQTYEAHRPENVIHGSFERAGSNDWAVLCSSHGTVSLLVFFASALSTPVPLRQAAETDSLQPSETPGIYGFDWGIDAASPHRIHEAQASMAHRPPPPDHDAVADSIIDQRIAYHLYRDGAWETVPTE